MKIDKNGLTWRTISLHLTDRLMALRELNDRTTLDPVQTAAVRGEIKAVKELLALPDAVEQVVQEPPGYGHED